MAEDRDFEWARLALGRAAAVVAVVATLGLSAFAVAHLASSTSGAKSTKTPDTETATTDGTFNHSASTASSGGHSTTSATGTLPLTGPTTGPAQPSRGGYRGSGGGHHSSGSHRGSPATLPPLGPVVGAKWVASPAVINLHPGAGTHGFVTVANRSTVRGTVLSPGCPSAPHAAGTTATALSAGFHSAAMCAPAGRVIIVQAHRSHSWEWAISATVTGKGGSAPLAPGTYLVTIGGATITMNVA